MRVLVVDHHDSYTWNLVHLIASVTGVLPSVVEHDEATLADLDGFTHIVLSPGPGHPAEERDFRLGREILAVADRPVLGVCLGMQGIVEAYGGLVSRVQPAHGDVARIMHDGQGLFVDVPSPFSAVRYHSLAAVEIPESLLVTARSEDGVVMGVRHRELPVEGVQFHPESVLSEYGAQVVGNFLR